jgi:hypothetical protein
VIENYSGLDYWSEKLADCFLAWTMPIYFGCTNIFNYFPRESMICVDVNDPHVIEIIQQGIKDKLWEKNLDAISEARNRILNQYQLFPFIVNQIRSHQQNCKNHQNKSINIPEFLRPPFTFEEKLGMGISNIRGRVQLHKKYQWILKKIKTGRTR